VTRQSAQIEIGEIEYDDVGSGRALVFIHGLLADEELWRPLSEQLRNQFRCITPTWPLGLHRVPAAKSADLSPAGHAQAIAEFLEVLGLKDAILVGNDSGGALCQLVCADHSERVGGLILTNCDALEVFPPKMFAYLKWLAHLPFGYALMAKVVRWLPFLRNSKIAWGGLSATDQSDVFARWSRKAAGNRRACRDAAKLGRTAHRSVTLGAAERLSNFTAPTLLLWGQDDRFFSPELATRLAARIPNAELELVANAKTFVSLDQPSLCANHIAAKFAPQAAARLA